jgi:hypothetical protein
MGTTGQDDRNRKQKQEVRDQKVREDRGQGQRGSPGVWRFVEKQQPPGAQTGNGLLKVDGISKTVILEQVRVW